MTATAVQVTVDLWFGEPRPGPIELLSADERLRADRFVSDAARAEFVATRTWLRSILAGYVGVPAASLRFRLGRWGKPSLVGYDLEFSVSHARGPVLVAVCAGHPVGVDLETLRPGVWDPAAASLVLTPQEMKTVRCATDPDAAFLGLWTRKEAYSKVFGRGLTDRLASVDLRADPTLVDGIEVRSLDLGPNFVASLACPQGAVGTWRTR